MSTRFLFWLLMLLWLIFGLWGYYPYNGHFVPLGGSLLLFILLFLLGWKSFGWPIDNA